MNKITGIIALIFILVLGLLYVLKLVIKSKNKKNISNAIDKLSTEKNMIISASLITELSKASKLVNNKKIEKEVEEWQSRFDDIENNDLPMLTNQIVEAENYCIEKDYENAYKSLALVEKNIFHIKAKSSSLLSEIRELTESEERNREAITKLKSIYREIVFKYNKNKSDYQDVSNRIELQFENIDKLFGAFETAVSNKEYEELGKIVKVLDDMVKNIGIVIDEAPTIVMLSTMILPKKMKDIKTVSTKMTNDGYNLEYLNIDYNIEETNKKIEEIMDRLNV